MTLCLEASGPLGSIAIVQGAHVIDEVAFEIPRGRGSAMFSRLEAIARQHGPTDAVLVGIGPGSYNALRSSIAAAWGLSAAWGVPLVGAASVLGYEGSDYQVIGDARAGQVFLATIRAGRLAAPPALWPAGLVASALDPTLPLWTAAASPLFPQAVERAPQARFLARPGLPLSPAEPIYLKPAHITVPKSCNDSP